MRKEKERKEGKMSEVIEKKVAREVYEEAYQAGLAALKGSVPVPMVVQGSANPLDDSSPVVKDWFVEGGVCGFAWINIYPARGPFVSWCKKNGVGNKAYGGGYKIGVREGGQSMERKEAFARAFAEVLQSYGLKANAGSRMD